MRIISIAVLFFAFYLGSPSIYANGKEKLKSKEKTGEKNLVRTRNFHAVKKWKMTIEYNNGDIVSKTIVVGKSSQYSALETAFMEAEKYSKRIKDIRDYSVTPISNNSYVLLLE